MSYSRRILKVVSQRALSQQRQQQVKSPAPTSSVLDISVALALYRLPIAAPLMTEIERNFANASYEIEAERSLKNNFELKMDYDTLLLKKRIKLEAEGKDLTELDEQIGVPNDQLIKDWKTNGDEIMKKFKLDGDFHSCEKPPTEFRRKLDRKLLLIVREKFPASGEDYTSPWILPQLKNNGEPLRQTAERCVGELFQSVIHVRFFGNAPFAHYRYRYPKRIAELTGSEVNHIFFFAVEMLSKSPLPDFNDRFVFSHRWSTAEEARVLTPPKYFKRFQTILVE